jgi:ASC-1-like (ASCH) protein
MTRTISGQSTIANKVNTFALPLKQIYILLILLLLKIYEVREDTPRVAHLRIGDCVCFFAGKWTIYCNIWSVERVRGSKRLLECFDWFRLIPTAKSAENCKEIYSKLGCKENTKLVVWGVTPLIVRHRDHQKGCKFNADNEHLISRAKHMLCEEYKFNM